MKDKKRGSIWLRVIPGILISILAIYAVLQFVNPQDLKNALSTVSLQFILVIVVFNLVSLLLRGKAWRTILGNKISFWQAFFGVSEGYFLNNILPFRAGEFGRSFFVGRSSGLGTMYTLSTIVIERALDIGFAAVLVVLTLPNLTGMDWMRPIAVVALIVVIVGLAGLFLLSRMKERVVAWLSRFEGKSRFFSFVIPLAKNLIEGFSTIKKPSQFFNALFWIALCWAVWSGLYFYMLVQILPGQPFWAGAFICSVLALGIAIPSAPAALGVFEAALTGAVVLLGGSTSSGFAYGLMVHLIHFVVVAIIGLWGLSRDQVSLSTLFTEILRKNTPRDETVSS
jgi:uncharacterized protein (TIRG00374 family)